MWSENVMVPVIAAFREGEETQGSKTGVEAKADQLLSCHLA